MGSVVVGSEVVRSTFVGSDQKIAAELGPSFILKLAA